jgi:glutathione S-transferase
MVATVFQGGFLITVYHLKRSRSERIAWLLEELALDYRLEPYDRVERYAPDSFRLIHPLGRAPVIRDGDTVLAESGAIVQYILGRHAGGCLSVDSHEASYASYLYWFHYAEASLMLQLLRESTLVRIVPEVDTHPGMAKVRATTREHLDFVDQSLAGRSFIASDRFTAADIMMLFPFTTLLEFLPGTLDLARYANLRSYVAQLTARPAYIRAMDRADGPQARRASA